VASCDCDVSDDSVSTHIGADDECCDLHDVSIGSGLNTQSA
jgi:hypothetical protein